MGFVPILYTYRYRIPQPPSGPVNPRQTANFAMHNRGPDGPESVPMHTALFGIGVDRVIDTSTPRTCI
ncbi:hypothetical protein MAAFP003_3973 [Mycobacterium ahvazicum]|uniref:Uncharacterized protein n=1 Tax=Mycobacterium ahvazicum TaxID=1964395 RepID=A0A2K4YES0_9MYCO|nr:hypothetical protein MAAFP003_3973 [Mycobacterium ahvazicum]